MATCAFAATGCAHGHVTEPGPTPGAVSVQSEEPVFLPTGPLTAQLGLDAKNTFAVVIQLNAEDAARFADFSRANIGKVVGMMVDGSEFWRAVMTGAVTDGRLEIAGSMTWADAHRTLKQLLPPAPQPGDVAPQPIGKPEQWISAADYPAESLAAHREDTVWVSLAIAANGKPTRCIVERASIDPLLDSAACALLLERGKFEPATNRSGRAKAATWRKKVIWTFIETSDN
jgi:TonB family protein